MFFELISRNSRQSRKENGLFFASLLVSIIAFYIILSLSQQDVMLFLQKMESDAVNRLLAMIPVFYGMTLVILFFLIYFASKFQLERRRHEFGVYLMLGMRRGKLFLMLLAEDFRSSIAALFIGLPLAVLLSELISLVTARLVGLGIIGHQFSLSLDAVLWTTVGFLLVKLAAFLILSGKISRRQIDALLAAAPEGARKEMPGIFYLLGMLVGMGCLGTAYYMAISGISWQQLGKMAITLVLGLTGTLLLFFGMRSVISLLIKAESWDNQLHVFNFRQLQENVIYQSSTLAISSLLILTALCCFGAGVAIADFYGKSDTHVLDYTFENNQEKDSAQGAEKIRETLAEHQLDRLFSDLFDVKVGYIYSTDDYKNAFRMDAVMDALSKLPESDAKHVLINNLGYADYPHLISLTGYNKVLQAAGLPTIELEEDEAAIYMDTEFVTAEHLLILNTIFADEPEAVLDGNLIHLTGTVHSAGIVTYRSITLSFALILPDEAFEYYTQNQYNIYVNGILGSDATQGVSLMTAIFEMNEKLDKTGLFYESYLQNIGRKLFYVVAASYITIYLAIIFLIIANTVMGVQFLMNQQKTNRRYQTLIRLGATYKVLCTSAKKQINWYFGIPIMIAAASSLFGVRALLSGFLPSQTQGNISELMLVSGAMILLLCVIEYIYITAVKRTTNRYLLTLMVPEREE